MAFEASLMLIILQWSLVVTVKSLEMCRLEKETMRTVSKQYLAAAIESVLLQEPLLLGPILSQTGMFERKHLREP